MTINGPIALCPLKPEHGQMTYFINAERYLCATCKWEREDAYAMEVARARWAQMWRSIGGEA